MAAGLPVIATKESGLPIENGIDGILVKSKDVISIVDALKRIYKDILLREALGKNAAAKIAENYSWEQYTQNVINLYNKLIKD